MSKVNIWAELIFRGKQALDALRSLQDKE